MTNDYRIRGTAANGQIRFIALTSQGIVEEARKEAAGIIERANAEAELEKKRVKDEVKQEMVNIASLMAAKVVARNIDTTVQDGLLEDTLKEIGDDTWRS